MNVAPGSSLVVAAPAAQGTRGSSSVLVRFYPRPFLPSDYRELRVPHGDSLAALVAEMFHYQTGPLARRFANGWRALVNGIEVPESDWTRTIPPPGATVVLSIRSSLESIIAAILFVGTFIVEHAAVILAVGTTLVSAGVSAFLSARSFSAPSAPRLVDAARPKPSSSRPGTDSPTLSGQGNSTRPYQPFPRLYGRHRVTPMILGKPFTEIDGGAVYMRVRYGFGYGPLKISDIRIGRTPIDEYRGTDVQVREGWTDDSSSRRPDLYPGSAVQEEYQARLHGSAGGSTGAKERVTALGTHEVGIEIVFPGGFVVYSDRESGAEELDREMRFRVGYRVAGTSGPFIRPGKNAEDEKFRVNSKQGYTKVTGPGTFTVGSKRNGTFFVGVRFYPGREDEVSAPGEYEIQLVVTNDVRDEGGPISAECLWQSMRSLSIGDTHTVAGQCTMDLRIKASNQLSGSIETLNALAESYMRYWDESNGWSGSANPSLAEKNNGWWVVDGSNEVGRNPAWHALDILTGRAQRYPVQDGKLDLPRWAAFADACQSYGHRCDAVIDFTKTTFHILSDILATGWARPYWRGTKRSVVWESDTSGQGIVASLTPRNVISYRGRKGFEPVPHALRHQFFDESRDYEPGERLVFRDGFDEQTATEYMQVEKWAVTNSEMAWRDARRKLAEMVLRPELFTVEQDVENLFLEVGDLVGLTYDVPLIGLATGAVKSRTLDGAGLVTAFVLDEELTFEVAKLYGVTIRSHEPPFGVVTVSVENPAVAVPLVTHSVTLEAGIAESAVPVGALVSFGEQGTEHFRALVKEVERVPGDLNSRLTLMPEAAGIWDALGGAIPPYDPGTTLPLESAPALPSIREVANGQGVISLLVAPGEGAGAPTRQFEVNFRVTDPSGILPDGEWARLQLYEVDGVETIDVGPVAEDRYYDIRVRALGGALNATSGWVDIPDWLYTGPTITAAAFRVVNLELKGQGSDPIWEGREPEVEWGLNSIEFTPNVLTEPNGIPPGQNDEDTRNPFFLDYEIRVVDPRDPQSSSANPVRTDHRFSRTWRYTRDAQLADMRKRASEFKTPMRTVRIGVAFRDRRGAPGPFMWREFENPPDRVTHATFGTSGGTVWAKNIQSFGNDTAEYRLHAVRVSDYPDPIANPPVLDLTLSEPTEGSTFKSKSTATQCEWLDAPRGEWWVYLFAIDEFGPEGSTPWGPSLVIVAGRGARRDIKIPATAIVAATANTLTLASGIFSADEADLVENDATVRIVVPDGELLSLAAGQAKRVIGWNVAMRVVTIDSAVPFDPVPVPGTDFAEVSVADISDGVLEEIHAGHGVFGRITLLRGAVSSGDFSRRQGFSEKPRRNRYRTAATASVRLSGEERVRIDTVIKTDEVTSGLAFNQVVFLREMARGVVVAPSFVSLDRAETLAKWSGLSATTLSLTDLPDAQEGSHAVKGTRALAIATPQVALDVSSHDLNLADTTIRWRWRGQASSGPSPVITAMRIMALKTAGDFLVQRAWNIATPPTSWRQETQNLASAPDVSIGSWDGKHIAQLVFLMFIDGGPPGTSIVWELIDDVEVQRAGNDAVRLIGDAVLEPGALASTGMDFDAGEHAYCVALRPLRRSDPENEPGVWDVGGVMEQNPAAIDQELFRAVISNDSNSIEVGTPPGSMSNAFPNQDFSGGEPQIGDEFIVFEVLEAFLKATQEADSLALTFNDFAPPGSGSPIQRTPTEYRVAVRRYKEPGGGVVDQPYTYAHVAAEEFGR